MTPNRKDLRPYNQVRDAASFSPVGVWQNELGSTMTVGTFDGTNFTGSYTSAVSGQGGTVTGELTGTLVGDAIAFLVNWKSEYSSVTAWSGLVLAVEENTAIYALWHLATTPESEGDAWQAINAGADLFVPIVE